MLLFSSQETVCEIIRHVLIDISCVPEFIGILYYFLEYYSTNHELNLNNISCHCSYYLCCFCAVCLAYFMHYFKISTQTAACAINRIHKHSKL